MTNPTAAQVKALLSPEQLARLGIYETDSGVDAAEEAILDAAAEVAQKTSSYAVEARLLTRWARVLAAHMLALVCGGPTADQAKEADQARKDMEKVGRGEWPGLATQAAPSGDADPVQYGGETNILSED